MCKIKKLGGKTKRKRKGYFQDEIDLLIDDSYGEKEEELFQKILKRIEEMKKNREK